MKRFALATLAACAALLAAESAAAQLSLSGELRGGAAFPTGEFGEIGPLGGEGLETGYVVGARAVVHLVPRVGVYAGYSFSRFEARDTRSIAVEDVGLSAGLRLFLPAQRGVVPWLEGGVVRREAELIFGDEFFPPVPQVVPIGARAHGGEVGAGAAIPLLPWLRLTPGVTYVRYSSVVESREKTVSYVTAELGVGIRP